MDAGNFHFDIRSILWAHLITIRNQFIIFAKIPSLHICIAYGSWHHGLDRKQCDDGKNLFKNIYMNISVFVLWNEGSSSEIHIVNNFSVRRDIHEFFHAREENQKWKKRRIRKDG